MDEMLVEEQDGEKCARCLVVVPRKASRCPHCGQPISHVRRTLVLTVGAVCLLALLVMLVLTYRLVYLTDLQGKAAEVEVTDPYADQATSAQRDESPKTDSKPSPPPAPEKAPPPNH